MNKSGSYKAIFLIIWVAFSALTAFPQQQVNLIPGQSSLKIRGTSSMHDWEEKVEKFDVNLILKIKDNEITGIDKVNFNCKSASITSDNSLMTNKTHDALLVEKFPEITFRLVSVDNLTSSGGIFSGTLSGDLSLAGVTKRVNITFTGNKTGNRFAVKGSKMLTMTEFKIKPPTAMLGTLKTGDAITISFDLQFQNGMISQK